mmetsp:Transcript_67090/g.187705  ORF Transcript_67090/g.187705 Transcript_67090/m.187705 type:complete len:200 (-) Transcript_67090:1293-1892(-)
MSKCSVFGLRSSQAVLCIAAGGFGEAAHSAESFTRCRATLLSKFSRRSVLYVSACKSKLVAGPLTFHKASSKKSSSTSFDLETLLSMSNTKSASRISKPMTSSVLDTEGLVITVLNSSQLTVPVQSTSRLLNTSLNSSRSHISVFRCSKASVCRSGCANFIAFSTNTPMMMLRSAIWVNATTKTNNAAVDPLASMSTSK